MLWGWIFAKLIRDGRSTKKVAKMMVEHWRLTFLRRSQVCLPMHLYGHHTFVWEKCWEFQTTYPLKPLGKCCSNFMWSPLRLGEGMIAKMVAVHWPRWLPCPYMLKTFKNLLPQNQIIPVTLPLQISSRTGDLLKLLKWWAYFEIWPFTARSNLLSTHLYRPYTFIWKKCWEFIFWTSSL